METNLNETPAPFPSSGKLIAGLALTAVGVLLTLDNLDLIHSGRYLEYWPAALIAAGVLKLITGGSHVAAAILTVLGSWLLLDNLDVIDFSLFDLWPLLLIGMGVGFVARGMGWKVGDAVVQAADEQRGGSLAILSTKKIAETSRDYRGGNAFAFLGSYELDLSGADITSGPAIIEVFAWWASVEITVPDHWEIVGEVTPFMAGFEVHTRGASDPSRRLIVRGAAIMGGVEVKNASRRTS